MIVFRYTYQSRETVTYTYHKIWGLKEKQVETDMYRKLTLTNEHNLKKAKV